MNIDQLKTLVAAVDAGSFSAVARARGAQVSVVSRQIAELESIVRAPLLVRTGRGVRPHPNAERFLERARLLIADADRALTELREARPAMKRLRVSAPLELALRLLATPIAKLSTAFPDLGIEVSSEARYVSLLEEEFDAALRIGPMSDTSLIARKLGDISLCFCAAPSVQGDFRRIDDLKSRELVLVAKAQSKLRVVQRRRAHAVELQGRIRVGSFTEAAALAAEGCGAVVLPSYTAVPYLEAKRLVRILRDARLEPAPLYLVMTPRMRGSEVLRHLGEAVARALAEMNEALDATLKKTARRRRVEARGR